MKTVAQNRRARFDYEILDRVEAGLMLTGQEVKSCRLGHVDLSGAYVSFLGGAPLLKQMKIRPYTFAGALPDYDPGRERKLLLHAREAAKLRTAAEEKGMTVIPVEVRAGRFIKIVLAVARGRKKGDKRTVIRERELKRKLKRGEEV